MTDRKPSGRNIGRGVSIWLAFQRACVEAHEDVDAFGAPSECHALVARSHERELRLVRRHIKAVTGLRFPRFRAEVARRTNGRVRHFVCQL